MPSANFHVIGHVAVPRGRNPVPPLARDQAGMLARKRNPAEWTQSGGIHIDIGTDGGMQSNPVRVIKRRASLASLRKTLAAKRIPAKAIEKLVAKCFSTEDATEAILDAIDRSPSTWSSEQKRLAVQFGCRICEGKK